jgi:hypothetical protein
MKRIVAALTPGLAVRQSAQGAQIKLSTAGQPPPDLAGASRAERHSFESPQRHQGRRLLRPRADSISQPVPAPAVLCDRYRFW